MTTPSLGVDADTAILDRTAREMPGLKLPDVPRRFLLIEYTDGSDTGAPEIFGWGLALTGFAIVFHPDGLTARLGSAERALSLFRHSCDDIVWLDPPEGEE